MARADGLLPGPKTEAGAQVGDTEESVVERYGNRVNVVAHPFLEENIGHYLMYQQQLPAEHDSGLIFETRHGRVTSYRVGGRSAVSQIEGCR